MNEEYTNQFVTDLVTILSNVLQNATSREIILSVCKDYSNHVDTGVLRHDGVLNTASAIIAFKIRKYENLADRYLDWRNIEKILYSVISESKERLLEEECISEEKWHRIRSQLHPTS